MIRDRIFAILSLLVAAAMVVTIWPLFVECLVDSAMSAGFGGTPKLSLGIVDLNGWQVYIPWIAVVFLGLVLVWNAFVLWRRGA